MLKISKMNCQYCHNRECTLYFVFKGRGWSYRKKFFQLYFIILIVSFKRAIDQSISKYKIRSMRLVSVLFTTTFVVAGIFADSIIPGRYHNILVDSNNNGETLTIISA